MTTLNLTLFDGTENGIEIVGVLFTNSAFAAGNDGGNMTGFVRYRSVAVPNGAVIASALLTLSVISINGTPVTRFFGIDEDDTAPFTTGARPSARARTTASGDADPSGMGAHVLDVTAVVQEIVSRVGWVSGNDLAIVVDNDGGAGGNFFEALTGAATLDIEYVDPPVPSLVAVALGGTSFARRAVTVGY